MTHALQLVFYVWQRGVFHQLPCESFMTFCYDDRIMHGKHGYPLIGELLDDAAHEF